MAAAFPPMGHRRGSRSIAGGLRIGVLAVPHWAERSAALRSQMSQTMISPLSAHVMEIWLTDGTSERIAHSIRSEAAHRSRLAQSIFVPTRSIAVADGFHAWLPMPTAEAEEFVLRAASMGILLMPAKAPMTDLASQDGGVRISLGGHDLALLEKALTVLGKLQPPTDGRSSFGDDPVS